MRTLIVSNRLPITATEKDGTLSFKRSVGGLSSGLSSYFQSAGAADSEYLWIGWPGTTIPESMHSEVERVARKEYRCCPVFLSEEEMEHFYHGFCNRTIWALFHYFPSFVNYDEENWTHYGKVNEIFGRKIREIAKPGDVIWIHDYHLMLLPAIVKRDLPDLPIGFFLHIPFPSYEIFRLLPSKWRTEILHGLLGADLLGFHTYDYVQHFLRTVSRIIGLESSMGEIPIDGERCVKVETFPMGINFGQFYGGVTTSQVQEEQQRLRTTWKDLRIILSIDRLDYSKGILNRLRAYEAFLEKNPDLHSKVILIMIVVPSRIGVDHYQMMKKQIDELVGRINGRFAKITWTPIHYQFKSLARSRLLALYSTSDVMLVTPLRDGMNLIAKEYVASRVDQTGVLILSEMAGASAELGEAIVINPSHVEEVADSLVEALSMPVEEQRSRMRSMQVRLRRYDVVRWATDFLQTLVSFKEQQRTPEPKLLTQTDQQELLSGYRRARRRLLLFDYDGTLVPLARRFDLANPGGRVQCLLRRLAERSENHVVLISGRDRETMVQWFGTTGVTLVAEHGIWLQERNSDWQMLKPARNDWKPQILPVLEVYCDRLPGAVIEEKDYSVAFHYREADPELASLRVKELSDYLRHQIANMDLHLLRGSKVLEVRNSGTDKGFAGLYLLAREQYNWILAIGDDYTDEDLFRALPESAYTIRIGVKLSNARYLIRNQSEALAIIESISEQ